MSCSHTKWIKHHEKWPRKGLKKNGSRGKTKTGVFFVLYCRVCNASRKMVPGSLRRSICPDGHVTEVRPGVRL